MIRVSTMAVLSLIVFALAAQAGPREDAEAKAAIDLALALKRHSPVMAAHKAERLTYAEAHARALKEGKPILLRVNDFPCEPTCEACKGCLLSDAAEIFSDSTPRLIMAYPQNGRLFVGAEWNRVPSIAEVESTVAKLSPCLNCPKGKCDSCEGQCSGQNCVAAKAVQTFAPAANCASGR